MLGTSLPFYGKRKIQNIGNVKLPVNFLVKTSPIIVGLPPAEILGFLFSRFNG